MKYVKSTTPKPLNQNNMKKTAVQWLIEQLTEIHPEAFEKAKAMEKEQIEKAFDKGLITENVYYGYDDKKAEQYYNKTFKSL